MKVSDYIFKYLKDYKIKDIFMLPGGGCMHLADSLGKSGIHYIPCLHEQVATIASIAYSQYLNKMGVVLVTTGPGGTNTLTGVAGAWADSMPLLVISGQVKTTDLSADTNVRMLGFQEVDIVSIVSPITKYAVTINNAEEIRYHLEKAIYSANSGKKGPVWLDIPLDIQSAEIEPEKLKGFIEPEKKIDNKIMKAAIETLKMIGEAQRPVILAGYGIKFAEAFDGFMELANIWNIPILTTWKGIDFLEESHPLYYGRPGSVGQRGANFIIQNCDLLISIGARMDYGQIGYEHQFFAREAKKIVIDIDSAEFNKFKFPIDLPVCGDAGDFIRELLLLGPTEILCNEWKKKCREWIQKYPVILPEFFISKDRVSTYAFVDRLSQKMDDKYVYAPCCSGVGIEILLQAVKIQKGVRFLLNCPGIGSMGYDIPTALGAAIASGRTTVCIAGDGGFQMNIQDLETIRRLGLPVKFFVLNNKGYGSIVNMQQAHFGGHFVAANEESGLTFPPLDKIAAAYGFEYDSIQKTEELDDKIAHVLSTEKPYICEVFTLAGEVSRPKVSSAMGKDGKMYSKPLEDLWPFLDREEFQKEMIVKPVGGDQRI